LAVYSAWDYGSPDISAYSTPHHSGYTLLSAEGVRLKHIVNWSASLPREPETIALSPGTYKINASAYGLGNVTVPITIEAGKTTSVHLDGSEPPGKARGSESEFVLLPNHSVIGWRANRPDNATH
jgi:hypothetical protein